MTISLGGLNFRYAKVCILGSRDKAGQRKSYRFNRNIFRPGYRMCIISKINLHSGHALPDKSSIVRLSNDGPIYIAECLSSVVMVVGYRV